jgi:competence protein ComFC
MSYKSVSFLTHLGRSFSHLLFPPLCLHCHEELEESFRILCPSCMGYLELVDASTRCPYCFTTDFDPEHDLCCQQCRQRPQFVHRTAAAFDYEGPAATLVKQMKYRGQPGLAHGAGALLALQFLRLQWPMPHCVIPMPMAPLRLMERGYNQSYLLAQALGKILCRPVLDVLGRKSGDFCQAGLNYQQRMKLGSDAFYLKTAPELRDKAILLVDDVMTTGSSLQRCGEALLGLYPESIFALTFCQAG